MKNSKKTIKGLFMIALSVTLMASCSKYKKYGENEVIENTFTGNVTDVSLDDEPDADFTGANDSGTYAFAWNNTGTRASVKFDITSPTGSFQIKLNDKKGKEVFNQTLNGGSDIDTYEGVSQEGKIGMWKVTIVFVDFNGDGSYEIDPVD